MGLCPQTEGLCLLLKPLSLSPGPPWQPGAAGSCWPRWSGEYLWGCLVVPQVAAGWRQRWGQKVVAIPISHCIHTTGDEG